MGSKKTGKGSLIVKSGIRAGSGKLATNHSRALLGHRWRTGYFSPWSCGTSQVAVARATARPCLPM